MNLLRIKDKFKAGKNIRALINDSYYKKGTILEMCSIDEMNNMIWCHGVEMLMKNTADGILYSNEQIQDLRKRYPRGNFGLHEDQFIQHWEVINEDWDN